MINTIDQLEMSVLKQFDYDNQIKLLWENDRWDGMLEGMCEVDGEKLYFKCCDMNEVIAGGWWRRYYLIRLTVFLAKESHVL